MPVTPHYIRERGGLSSGVLTAPAAPMRKKVVIAPDELSKLIAHWVLALRYCW